LEPKQQQLGGLLVGLVVAQQLPLKQQELEVVRRLEVEEEEPELVQAQQE